MKKTKITGKNSKKKISKPSPSKQQKQVKAKNNSAAETLSRKSGLTKKDSPKKTDNGVSLPKKYFSIVRQFLADSKMELKKVTWPTKKELFSVTAVVIVLVFFIAFFLGLVDFGLVKIIKNIVG
jgi:preprotein translocase subunit SecE